MQTNISPLACVREWISKLSWFVFNTAPVDRVSWVGETMLLDQHSINIPKVITAVHTTLAGLRKHVHEKVLFGIKVDFELPTADNTSEGTHGYTLFGPQKESNENKQSAAFLRALLQAKKLCRRAPNGTIIWDIGEVTQWLLDIGRSWRDVYCLLHILSLPGRGTEELLFQWGNTGETRRHLYLIKYVMGLISNYHKGHSTTGLYKQILRLIPNELGYLMAILLRIVRPVEVIAIAKYFVDKKDQIAVKKLYRTRIFVSNGKVWRKGVMSQSLKAWWMKHMDLPIGLRLHRQFAVSLQRNKLNYRKDDPRRAAAQQALAHGRMADELNYGKKKGDSNMPKSRQEHFDAVSRDYLKVFGFKDPESYKDSKTLFCS